MEFGGLVLLRMPLRSPAISAASRGPITPRASAGWSRARCLGHRLHAEMTLAVDPALSLADSSKLADEIKEHTHRRLAALEGLHVEVIPSLRPGKT